MSVELFERAFEQSLENKRRGDLPEETAYLAKLVKNSRIALISGNAEKVEIFKNTLRLFGIEKTAEVILKNSSQFDLCDTPAIAKAIAGKNLYQKADLYLARGRLGLPGSGALTVLINKSGQILSAVTSPPHHLGNYPLETAVFVDTFNLLLRLGLKPKHRGITEKTLTVYSGLSLFDTFGAVAERKWKPLEVLIEKLKPERCLIVGGYLDGLFFAEKLRQKGCSVALTDTEGAVLEVFSQGVERLKEPRGEFDLVLDLTGFGGFEDYKQLRFKNLLVELPGEGFEKEFPRGVYLLKGKNLRGSYGTMSLTVKVVRKASERVEERKGVFYCVPNLLNLESLLFNAKSPRSFLFLSKGYPALSASAPAEFAPAPRELDAALLSEVERLDFEILKV